MSCSTSFFNKAALLAFLLTAALCGCGGQRGEIIIFVPQPDASEQDIAASGQKTEPSLHRGMLIAVLPVENLSGTSAPLENIVDSVTFALVKNGFRVVNKTVLEQFRKKHRMRYTGGLNASLSEAMLRELGADAVLITSLEAYQEEDPPQISLIARLVSCGPRPEIIWIDSIGLSGDEAPGLLDLHLITSAGQLLRNGVARLTDSLAAGFSKETGRPVRREPATMPQAGRSGRLFGLWPNRSYQPHDYFRSPLLDAAREYSIAVIPMLDLASRKDSGIIAQLHFVRELFNQTDFQVVEPGLVREELLRIRAIMPYGPSLAETDLITGKELLGVDLVLAGKVFDYQNTSSNPKADISVQVIEKNSRRIVFGARTFSTGLDNVYFYDYGREYTAHNLLREMARVTVQLLTTPAGGEEAVSAIFRQRVVRK